MLLAIGACTVPMSCAGDDASPSPVPAVRVAGARGPWHQGVRATVFWVGEDASADNGGIANAASAWDDDWLHHFGGVDDPEARAPDGVLPRVTAAENPFYVALPYNDFAADGTRKRDAASVVPWAGERQWGPHDSMCKNQWVQITAKDRVVYAQWEDVGPFGEDDAASVFGTAAPANRVDERAGIDLSPAVRAALEIGDVAEVDWRFVDEVSVPEGPWRRVVTRSQITWHGAG